MTAEQYFEEEMSGEPLTQDAVIEGLKGYAREVLNDFVEDLDFRIETVISEEYKDTCKRKFK